LIFRRFRNQLAGAAKSPFTVEERWLDSACRIYQGAPPISPISPRKLFSLCVAKEEVRSFVILLLCEDGFNFNWPIDSPTGPTTRPPKDKTQTTRVLRASLGAIPYTKSSCRLSQLKATRQTVMNRGGSHALVVKVHHGSEIDSIT